METRLQKARDRHLKFHASIAARADQIEKKRSVIAAQKSSPPLPAAFSRYVIDSHYDRAWCIALLGYDPRPHPIPPSIDEIQKVVCEHFRISRVDLLSDRRTKVLVRPRQIAVYLCRNLTGKSMPEIGRKFGDRDHTTILHAVRMMTERRGREPDLNEQIVHLEKSLMD